MAQRRAIHFSRSSRKLVERSIAIAKEQPREDHGSTKSNNIPSHGGWGNTTFKPIWTQNSSQAKLSPEEMRQKSAFIKTAGPVQNLQPRPQPQPSQPDSGSTFRITRYSFDRYDAVRPSGVSHIPLQPVPRAPPINSLPRQEQSSIPLQWRKIDLGPHSEQTSIPSIPRPTISIRRVEQRLSNVFTDRQQQRRSEEAASGGAYVSVTGVNAPEKKKDSWKQWSSVIQDQWARTDGASSQVPVQSPVTSNIYSAPTEPGKDSSSSVDNLEKTEDNHDNTNASENTAEWVTSIPSPVVSHAPMPAISKKRRDMMNLYGDEYDEDLERQTRKERKARRRKKKKELKKKLVPIYLPEFISIGNLATALRIDFEEFDAKLKYLGFEDTNHDYIIDGETAGLIASEFNYEPMLDRKDELDLVALPVPQDKTTLPPRPPVITIMGHVDHGKTTILDYLRKSSIAASEYGGITQHIGAFSVTMPSGKTMTFLDTPGHAAFLSMRQRGANVTDIVVLVVAADDSVKPQTVEAITHAKAAGVPILVAINKIDKEEADAEKVKQDLVRHGVVVEDIGGDTQAVSVSGKTGQGMHDLEEAIITLAELQDMRAEIDGPAEGWVIETTTKRGGRAATVLVKRGTVKPGDIVVAGTTWARIRTLKNEAGVSVKLARPGTPVEIDGWKDQPTAGDEVLQACDEQKAKSVVQYRLEQKELLKLSEDMTAINEQRTEQRANREEDEEKHDVVESAAGESAADVDTVEERGMTEVFVVIKGDTSGSVEAVANAISGLGNKEIRSHIIRSGVGAVSESDVEIAESASPSFILTFNVDTDQHIRRIAEKAEVRILEHNIIYELIEEMTAKMSDYLKPRVFKDVVGEAEIAQVFDINIRGREYTKIAGCKIRNGLITRNKKVQVMRNDQVIFDGRLSSLKSQKKDVLEVRKGSDCGMGFEEWKEFVVGDQIKCYDERVEKQTLLPEMP